MKNKAIILIFITVLAAACILYVATGGLFGVTTDNPANPAGSENDRPSLIINEVMASNSSAVPDEEGNFPDWVELFNDGTEPVNLRGFGLSDTAGDIKWVFPAVEIRPQEYLLVFCSGRNIARADAEYLHTNFKIKSSDTVVLTDSSGTPLDSIKMVDVGSNVSIGRGTDGKTDEWHNYTNPTPGFPNTEQGYEEYKRSMDASSVGVVVNELMPSNKTTIPDENGNYNDWIELYNTAGETVDLSGFGLSDDYASPLKWRFPDGTTIAPGGYLLVFASGEADPFGTAHTNLHASFRLNSYKESVILANKRGQVVDRADYQEVPSDASYGRKDDEWVVFGKPTPGHPNTDAGFEEFQKQYAFVPDGLMISEVMSSNSGYVQAEDKQYYDWIELFNPTGAAVDLEGYALSDNSGNPVQWRFPKKSIGPGEYLVVLASGNDVTDAKKKYLETNFALAKSGEVLTLATPEGIIIDRFNLGEVPGAMSFGRKAGELLYFDKPTPGEPNGQGWPGFAPAPEIITKAGFYKGRAQAEVAVPEGTIVRYTLDGSEPSKDSQQYNGALGFDKTGVLRVKAFKDGLLPSAAVTATYIIDSPHELPVIALSTDPKNMWDPQTGIYVEGNRVTGKANYMNEWERPVHFEFFEADGTLDVGIDAVFRIFGAYSRAERDQKGFALIARGEYGPSVISFPFFSSRPYKEYKSLVFRASAMDSTITKFRDILATSIAGDGGILEVQAYRQCVMYINGEYFGIYNLREKINKHFLAQHYGVNPENIDLLVGNGTSTGSILGGDNKDYKALMDWLKDHELKGDENYKYIEERIDVDNYIEFLFAEMFFMNTDSGNIKFFRERTTGSKWRWLFYDLDWGFAASSIQRNPFEYWLNPNGHGSSKGFSTLLTRRLFENQQFRNKFIERSAYLLTHNYTSANLVARCDEMTTAIESEMPRDAAKWPQGGGMGNWRSCVKGTRKFVEQRPEYMVYQIKKYFGLSDAKTQELFGQKGTAPTGD